ncbi:MAG TPA: glycoside hydrolase family 31 protein, partial [Lachnospiraceae bacterium]|nr:glycoside hydrolase family 31 protein [Lachnospiraceae bacterium]
MVIKLANGSFLRLMPVCGNIMRVTCSRETFFYDDSMLVEQEVFSEKIPAVRIDELHTEKSKNIVSVQAGGLKMTIGLQDGALQAEDIKSKEVLLSCCRAEISKTMVMRYTTGGEKPVIERRKTVDGERNFIKNLKEVPDHEAYRAKLYFSFLEGEGIYGFGQAEEGIYNYRKTHQYLYQHNMRIPMPFFYSDHGYGIFFDCCSLMTFQDDCDGSYVYMDAVRQLDFYIIAGKSPDQVIGGLRFLTGKAAMLPKWAFGYIQSKEQYYTAKELADIVRRYRKLAVPLDCVVQDWNTWEPGNWGEKLLDKTRYGDLKERIKEIRQMHAHAMISVWPNMNTGGQNHKEFSDAGYLLHDDSTYDAFDEKARAMYWKQAKEELFNSGFEAWWCDSSEPFSGPDWGGEVKREPWERFTLVGGEHKKYLPWESANIYALMHAKGIYENQRKETEEIRVLNLTRSGYASGQKYAAVLWSGDTCASYETLKKQIIEGLNMGLSGYPYWTLDIGAFFTVGDEWRNRGCGCKQDPTPKWFWKGMYNKGVKDKAYCELYVRWLQMGTFLPMFRSHGTDTPREIWNFGKSGEPFYDAIEKSIRLRYRLMPYIYSMAGMVRHENEMIMR